ncbi:MAG: hypothetical protein AABX84_02945 [Nanoarchaeota archaeon]
MEQLVQYLILERRARTVSGRTDDEKWRYLSKEDNNKRRTIQSNLRGYEISGEELVDELVGYLENSGVRIIIPEEKREADSKLKKLKLN